MAVPIVILRYVEPSAAWTSLHFSRIRLDRHAAVAMRAGASSSQNAGPLKSD